jgi:hypothetical protein
MIQNDALQPTLWRRGWCKGCIAYDICGAQRTECDSFQHYRNEVLSPDHPQLLCWAAEVRGFGFSDVVAQPTKSLKLPAYIPCVEGTGCANVDASEHPFIAVALSDIFSEIRLRSKREDDVRQRFGLPQDRKVILLGIARDDLLERIWRPETNVYQAIAAHNFDLATAFNYSIWFTEPRLEHLLNLKRSLLTFERLQDLGVPVIPHVYWYNEPDLHRWADWLSGNQVRMIATNLQTARKYSAWKRLLAGIEWMGENFPEHLEYLVIGPSSADRINAIRSYLPRVTFCNKDAYMLAVKRRCKIWNGSEFEEAPSDREPAVLFHHNVALINRVAQGNPPPAFSPAGGVSMALMEQLTLPSIFSEIQEYDQQLPLLAV